MIVLRFLAALWATLGSRRQRGPGRPSWGLLFESSVALLREHARAISGQSMQAQRAGWAQLAAPPSPAQLRVRTSKAELGGLPCAWLTPRAGAGQAVVLYFHGGSFAWGSLATHRDVVSRIALGASARVLFPDYRLAPEHPYPAALEDCRAVYEALLAQGVAPGQVVLAGDSAGGNLAITVALALRDAGRPLPAGLVAICPWVDLARRGGTLESHQGADWGFTADFIQWGESYLGATPATTALASPAHADLAGLPPLLIQAGEAEMLWDQELALAERARAAGVAVTFESFPDMVHNWHTLHDFTPQAPRAFAGIARFVRQVTG